MKALFKNIGGYEINSIANKLLSSFLIINGPAVNLNVCLVKLVDALLCQCGVSYIRIKPVGFHQLDLFIGILREEILYGLVGKKLSDFYKVIYLEGYKRNGKRR